MATSTKRRARRGTGSVYRDPKRGTWCGKVTIDGKVRRVRAKTKLEARQKLTALLDAGPEAIVARGARVSDLTAMFRQRPKGSWAPATRERHKWACKVIDDTIGHMDATRLRVGHVEDALEVLADRGLSKESLRQIRSTLRQVFVAARKRGLVEHQPADGAEIPDQAAPAVRRKSLDPSEARKLLRTLEQYDEGLPFVLQLRLGLRPGEVHALQWDAIDLDEGTLTVSRSLRLDRGRVTVTDALKTEASRRTLGLAPDLLALIRTYRRSHIGSLLFTTRDGNPIDPKQQRARLTAFCEEAGVTRVTPNELRHTAASLLVDNGASLVSVSDLLGHRTTRMLEQTYRHRVRRVITTADGYNWASEA